VNVLLTRVAQGQWPSSGDRRGEYGYEHLPISVVRSTCQWLGHQGHLPQCRASKVRRSRTVPRPNRSIRSGGGFGGHLSGKYRPVGERRLVLLPFLDIAAAIGFGAGEVIGALRALVRIVALTRFRFNRQVIDQVLFQLGHLAFEYTQLVI
jgi:hypothetical protein